MDPLYDGGKGLDPTAEQTQLDVAGATPEQLSKHEGPALSCPPGYKNIADKLVSTIVVHCFRFVKPGDSGGLAGDALVYVNGHWAYFPKPFRYLNPAAPVVPSATPAASGAPAAPAAPGDGRALGPMPARLHLVDGTFELFRAHFSKRPGHRAPGSSGPWDAKATVGVASSLLALLHDEHEAVTHLAVAFDNPIRSFRNDLFAGYKTDDGVPKELLAQFGPVEEAARALGLVVWSMDRWEADDALATAAARFRDRFDQVRILTPDKDLGQSLRAGKVVQVDRVRQREIDVAALLDARGVEPASIPDLLALVGDTADGIPACPASATRRPPPCSAATATSKPSPTTPPAGRSRSAARPGSPPPSASSAPRRSSTASWPPWSRTSPCPSKSPTTCSFRGVPREAFSTWCDRLGVTTLKARPTRWA